MKEIDALAKVVVAIIVLPLKIVSWVVKVARQKYQKALLKWRAKSSKKLQAKAENHDKHRGVTALSKFKMSFEDIKPNRKWQKIGKKK